MYSPLWQPSSSMSWRTSLSSRRASPVADCRCGESPTRADHDFCQGARSATRRGSIDSTMKAIHGRETARDDLGETRSSRVRENPICMPISRDCRNAEGKQGRGLAMNKNGRNRDIDLPSRLRREWKTRVWGRLGPRRAQRRRFCGRLARKNGAGLGFFRQVRVPVLPNRVWPNLIIGSTRLAAAPR